MAYERMKPIYILLRKESENSPFKHRFCPETDQLMTVLNNLLTF